MEVEVDHYEVLGLRSGEEGAKLTESEISKAYRSKALELHPDKRPNDRNAHSEFQKLKTSYEILKDEKARRLFDDLLRVKRAQRQRQSQFDVKRRKMMSDLDERERAVFAPDPAPKAREEEEQISKKLKEEIARIRAMHARNAGAATTSANVEMKGKGSEGVRSSGSLDGDKVLKVSWDGVGDDYSAQRLKELFGEFGEVEDVVIRSKGSKKKRTRSALVVMASKEAALAALGSACGDLSNPLLVLPLNRTTPDEFPSMSSANECTHGGGQELNDLVGAGYQAKEDSILTKLRKMQLSLSLGDSNKSSSFPASSAADFQMPEKGPSSDPTVWNAVGLKICAVSYSRVVSPHIRNPKKHWAWEVC